jgi:hypothetical protein
MISPLAQRHAGLQPLGERTAIFEHAAGALGRNAVRDIDTRPQTQSVSQNWITWSL